MTASEKLTAWAGKKGVSLKPAKVKIKEGKVSSSVLKDLTMKILKDFGYVE
jgi:hypothetical protein